MHASPAKKVRSFFLAGSIAIFLIFVVLRFMFGIAIVSGKSMEPALYEGDIIIYWRLPSSYQKNDIVLIKTKGSHDYVKRICAAEGDVIDTQNGRLYINGEMVDETFVNTDADGETGFKYPLTMGANQYFVLGDNRAISLDSRHFGAVELDQIDGKLLFLMRGRIQHEIYE